MAPKKNYSIDQMARALEDVQHGVPVSVAAKNRGVPRTTLLYKKEGKSPLICSMGPATILTQNEESILVEWILQLSERHFPISKEQLLDSVQKIMIESKKEKSFANNNRPSDKWFVLFLRRHPVIAERISQNLTQSRESVTEDKIRSWFEEVKNYLSTKNLFGITSDPNRVFNADESAFYLSPKEGKVLARKGDKNIYRAGGDEKENITVLVTANAAGKVAPPMIVLAYERIPSAIASSVPKHWALGTSDNGWMCSATFFEYITNIFNPWLIKEEIAKPIIFFVDGHVSHLTLHLSNFCAQNGIELVALYPNSTHLLQPMDVAVFRPLKLAYKTEVQNWRLDNFGNRLQKQYFANVFQKALHQISADTITNGFIASGLCPFNVDNVHFSKIARKDNTPISRKSEIRSLSTSVSTLKYLEEKIGEQKLETFKRSFLDNLLWNDPIEDKSLFNIWRELTLDAQKNTDQKDMGLERSNNEQKSLNVAHTITCTTTENKKSPVHRTPEKMLEKKTDGCQPSTSGTSSIIPSGTQIPFNVPTPFKKALFWPDPKPLTRKRKLKEKIPSVVTSDAWRTYYTKKENEKTKKLLEKEERKLERQEKLLKKNIGTTESSEEEEHEEWNASGNSSDEVDIFEDRSEEFCALTQGGISVGNYALVKFVGGKRQTTIYRYVCIIQEIMDNNDIMVMSMKSVNNKKIFVCNDKDISCIQKKNILGLLPTPRMLASGERIRYEFCLPVDVFES